MSLLSDVKAKDTQCRFDACLTQIQQVKGKACEESYGGTLDGYHRHLGRERVTSGRRSGVKLSERVKDLGMTFGIQETTGLRRRVVEFCKREPSSKSEIQSELQTLREDLLNAQCWRSVVNRTEEMVNVWASLVEWGATLDNDEGLKTKLLPDVPTLNTFNSGQDPEVTFGTGTDHSGKTIGDLVEAARLSALEARAAFKSLELANVERDRTAASSFKTALNDLESYVTTARDAHLKQYHDRKRLLNTVCALLTKLDTPSVANEQNSSDRE